MTIGEVTKQYVEDAVSKLKADLVNGAVVLPQVPTVTPTFAGGRNYCPDSDLSYSLDAVTVFGTLPASPGDGNYEAWRWYRQIQGDDVTVAPGESLKALGESTYPANEGANPYIPDWDRDNGWIRIGSAVGSPKQYDVAVQLPAKIISPGKVWYVRPRFVCLEPDTLPADVQFYAGIWVDNGGTQGWATGGSFDLDFRIVGVPGTTSVNYRVLARTDGKEEVLSNILNVPNAPDTLSVDNYIQLFYNAGPGFIEFAIYKEVAGIFSLLFTVRNTTDFQYNDIGAPGVPKPDWPAVSANAPRAYDQTRAIVIPPFGAMWTPSKVTLRIPSTYDATATDVDGQFLRMGLTAPTAVDRHVGIDLIWFSTSLNEWSPDELPPFADKSLPIPTVAQASSNQGGGGGVDPPGGPCVTTRMPVQVSVNGKMAFVPYSSTRIGQRVKGDQPTLYSIAKKRPGTSAGYYVITTQNGICYECNAGHRLVLDVKNRVFLAAEHVKVGTKLAGETKGRAIMTTVTAVYHIPESVEVGTYVLRDPSGAYRDGEGMYVAGFSKNMDRGLLSSNVKPNQE